MTDHISSNGSSKTDSSYDWRAVHNDLESEHFIGTYGGDNSAYHGLAGVRAGVDMARFHSKRSPDEFYVESLEQILKNPQTQSRWETIITLDPLGMFATRPTMSATEACMTIPELQTANQLESDGRVVNPDLTINCVKMAIDFAWNLPRLAERLKMDESLMRKALAESTQNSQLLDLNYKTYLPPVGGATLYFFGDIAKLQDKTTEVAVRVHDACCGSDVFGTDICTCRPYLIFALQCAVQCAQRGGVGIIAYFRKEGRSLGEVTKFRVYNARKRQAGGDTAANYFKQTESIAGIRDARFQEMMPDVLSLLGITRIDWLLSMSSDKYDAIINGGIEVMQRVSLPDSFVPQAAVVEITAKINAGYHTESIDAETTASELRSLSMIRSRCKKIFELSQSGHSKHFNLNLEKIPSVVDFVLKVTKENYGENISSIPYHSRWRHFNQNDVNNMIKTWHCDKTEIARRLIDLVTISVLLDAGAGNDWHYIDEHGNKQSRSEGLAIATFEMFRDGMFSSDLASPHRVNSLGLKTLSLKSFSKGLQISESNPIVGLESRFELLKRVGKALEMNKEFFGWEVSRPGNLIDFILLNKNPNNEVSIKILWRVIIEGLETIWPQHLSGVRRGDVWSYSMLREIGQPASDLVPFHKLSQWLTYSLLEPIESLGIKFTDLELMTGLAEYRNGGLFVDSEVIIPKNSETLKMEFDAGSELVVEWRALTICLIDLVWEEMRKKLNLTKEQFPLACLLQGGTWSAGRIIAQEKRANRTSPIQVRSDGTVF